MYFDYNVKREVTVTMINYMKEIVDEFPENISEKVNNSASEKKFLM